MVSGDLLEKLVAAAGAVAVVGGLYNLVMIPESQEGVFGAIRESVEVAQWAASSTAVNSAVFLVVGAALVVVSVRADFDG